MLLCALAAAATGEFMAIELPSLSLSMQASSEMGPLSEMLAQLNGQLHMRPPTLALPPNPCSQDLQRLRCTDSACLKRSAEGLAPACAAFLRAPFTPPPAQGPPAAASAVSSSGPEMSGFFSMSVSNSDGDVRRVSGPLPAGGLSGGLALGPPMGFPFTSLLPPGIASLFALDEEEEDEEDEGEAQHPCAREVPLCVKETGSHDASAIHGCLLKHLDALSPECKCFVHHMSRQGAPPPAKPPPTTVKRPAEPPRTVAVTLAQASGPPTVVAARVVTVGAAEDLEDDADDARNLPFRRLSCMLLLTTLFLATYLLARSLMLALCSPRVPARRIVVVPPPDEPPIAARTPTADGTPVQVAELYVKA